MKLKNTEENDIARYYNNNTPGFLRFGRTKMTGAIHRRLYAEEPEEEANPANYSDTLVLDLIKGIDAHRILDLGCGVGGSIRYLKSRYPADYTGITLSPVQVEIAGELDTEIELGSYLDPSWYEERKAFDVIFAIESLQHNPNHILLINNLKGVMKKSSRFIIIDDFIIEGKTLSRRDERLIQRFKKHWHSHGYTQVDDFISIMVANGFTLCEKKDLSSLMKKQIINKHLLSAAIFIISLLPFRTSAIENIIGGWSLLLLQQLKLSGYYKLEFRII